MRSRAFRQGWVRQFMARAWATSGLLPRRSDSPAEGGLALSHSSTRFPFIPAELNSGSHDASPLKCLRASRVIRVSGKTEISSTHSQFPKNCIIKPGHWPSLRVVVCFLLPSVLCFILLGNSCPAELSSVSEVFSSILLTAPRCCNRYNNM